MGSQPVKLKRDALQCQARRLAEAAARDLFTNGAGQRGGWLVLMRGEGVIHPSLSLGGWGFGPLVERLAPRFELALAGAAAAAGETKQRKPKRRKERRQ